MSPKPPRAPDGGDQTLRRRAEQRLAQELASAGAAPANAAELLHELQVHQIELEMQNENLRQTQIALQESYERYVDLYEFAPVGYLTLTREGQITEINLAGAALLGEERAKLLRRRFSRFVHPEDRDRWERHFLLATQQPAPHACELALRRADAGVLHVQADCLRVDNYQREPQVRVALSDRSELHQAETERRASDARFRAVVQSANDAVVSIDSAGKVVDWNPSAERLFGYAQAEISGHSLARILPERFRQRHSEGLARLAAGGAAHVLGKKVELAGLRKDGGEFPLELSLASWRSGDAWFYTGVMRDLSARRRIEAARVLLEKQLREPQKMEVLGTLAAGVADDFNNALATIMGNVELARQDLGPAHMALDSLEEIGKASARAKHLVNQILAFGRRAVLERKTLALAPVVEEAAKLLRSALPAGVSLQVDCAPDAPEVMGDAGHIEQVLLNLCNNAWQSMKGQSRQGAIRIALQAYERPPGAAPAAPALRAYGELRPGRYALLSVSDNGAGMDESIQGHLFEPFFTTKPVGEGAGLGLAVVHGIALAHEASIEVQSAPGEGTTISLYFPAAAAQRAPAPGPRQDGERGAKVLALPLKGRRVLRSDDDDTIV